MKRVTIFLIFLSGCSTSMAITTPVEYVSPTEVEQALNTAKTSTIYSLEPEAKHMRAEYQPKGEKLHGYAILGEAKLDEQQTRQAISVYKSAIANYRREDGVSQCMFEPRHALRITSNGHTFDLLACYHCGQLAVFDEDKNDDEQKPMWRDIKGSPKILNDILVGANIPLSKTGN